MSSDVSDYGSEKGAMSFEAMTGFGDLYLNMVCSIQIDANYEFYKTLGIPVSDPFKFAKQSTVL